MYVHNIMNKIKYNLAKLLAFVLINKWRILFSDKLQHIMTEQMAKTYIFRTYKRTADKSKYTIRRIDVANTKVHLTSKYVNEHKYNHRHITTKDTDKIYVYYCVHFCLNPRGELKLQSVIENIVR